MAPTSTAAPPSSAPRKSRTGDARLRAHAVRPVTVPLEDVRSGTLTTHRSIGCASSRRDVGSGLETFEREVQAMRGRIWIAGACALAAAVPVAIDSPAAVAAAP